MIFGEIPTWAWVFEGAVARNTTSQVTLCLSTNNEFVLIHQLTSPALVLERTIFLSIERISLVTPIVSKIQIVYF